MITVAGIDHIVLRTSRLAQMLIFYRDILGCEIERESAPETGLTQLRAGNALIDLVVVDSELGKAGGGNPTLTENNMDHFCLQIHPLSESDVITYLESHQIEAGEFARRYGAGGYGRSLYINDPEGNVVELRFQI